jgi:hypothetical protein
MLHKSAVLLGLFVLGGCEAGQQSAPRALDVVVPSDAPTSSKQEELRMWMTIGEHRFSITLTNSAASAAFAALLPLEVDMAELNGNEKYAELPQALPTSASRPGRIHNGDLMLYGEKTLVVFYSTFNSPYSYTRLGRVDSPAALQEALGRRGVHVVFSVE